LTSLNYFVSFDTDLIQRDRVYDYLSQSYWSPNLRRDLFDQGLQNSLCVGAYEEGTNKQIAFARLVTDYARFAYLCDVFVFDEYQGKGVAQRMLDELFNHEKVKTVGHWLLATKDAHKLYEKLGFEAAGERYMRMGRSSDRWQEPSSNS
jgi:GNAT superfamily N-acetyltransferase